MIQDQTWTPYDEEVEALAESITESWARNRMRILKRKAEGYRASLASAPAFPNVLRLKARMKALRIVLANAKDTLEGEDAQVIEDAQLMDELILMEEAIEQYEEKKNNDHATV